MKLHLPARLRSALLACMALVAPIACTVASGAFVGLGAVAALATSVASAAEIQVPSGSTVDYASGNTYILSGGTLNVASGAVSSAIKVNDAESTVNVASGAKLSPLYVTLGEGVESYKLAGAGTYDLGTATSMYGASVNGTGWTGVTSITKATGVGNFNFNTYGNAQSEVKVSGVAGWLAFGVAFNPTVWLEDAADGSAALFIPDGSSNRTYTFNGMKGAGTFHRGKTDNKAFAGQMTYAFQGDVSEWTGKYVNDYGETILSFSGAATELNMGEIVNNSGYALSVNFNGASASVVNTKIHTTAGGALNLNVNNADGVTFNNEVSASAFTANGSTTVSATGSLTVSGATELNSTLRVEGVASLQGGATVNRTIENTGSLTIAGELKVNSEHLRATATGDSSFSAGKNGFMETGQIQYHVVDSTSGGRLNVSGATFSFDGSKEVELRNDGTVWQNKPAGDKTYWINDGDVSLTSITDASAYQMNGGVLVLDKTDAAAQGQELIKVKGDKGTVKITSNTTLSGAMTTKAVCDLVVSGATLKVGEAEAQAVNISSFSSVTLENNALIRIQAKSLSINNLTVAETGGRIDVRDTEGVPSANPYVFAGVTTLHGTLTRTPDGGWGNGMSFEQVAGKGSLVYVNNPNEQSFVAINSLQDFEGNLSFTQNNNNGSAYEVKIASGKADVAMQSLTIGRSNKLTTADFANMTGSIAVESGKKLALSGALTMQSNLDLSITGAAGLQLNGGLIVQGVDNNLSIIGDSALNLGTLQVQAGAALAVNGLVSSLAMNQAGVLVKDNLMLKDGGSLVYNADATVMHIGSDNLEGSVKVDLNSLTAAQSQAISQGTPFDLGIDGAISKGLIGTIADNIRDLKMEVIDGTWKVTGGVVSMFWEGGSANWNTSDANWAFQDGAPATQTYVDGTDAIFSGATATVTVGNSVQVQNIEVIDGKYTFDCNYIGGLAIGNDLIVGDGASATFNKVFSKDMTVAGDVSVGKGGALSISMDSVSVAGGLSGAGSVSVNSDLSLGASSDIGQLKVTGAVSMTGTSTADKPARDLSVGGTSSVGALNGVETLTVKANSTMSVAAGATTLGTLAGDGSLTTKKLSLTTGASSLGSLTATEVTMASGVTLEVGTLNAPKVTATMFSGLGMDTVILSADKTVGDTVVVLDVPTVDSLKKLTNGQEVTVASISQPGGAVNGVLVAPVHADVTVKSDTEFSVTSNLRGFGYRMEVSDDDTLVTMTVGRDNRGWFGSASDTWTQGSQTGWEVGFIPNPTNRAAGFFGDPESSSIVNVDEAGVHTALVDVDIAKGALESKPSYTFVGGDVTTEKLIVAQGELIIANNTFVKQNAEVYSNGKLTIADSAHMEVYGDTSLTDDVSLTVGSDAIFTTSGILSAEEAVTITNKGMFTIGTAGIAGAVTNEGTLQVEEGGSIGSVKGGTLYAMTGATGTLKVGSVDVSVLQIATTDSTVELSGDSVIGSLYSEKEGTSLISSAKLTLTDVASNRGGVIDVKAQALTLNKIGNEFGALDAPVITLDLKEDVLSTEIAAVSVESIVAVNSVQIELTQSVIDSLPLGADNIIVADDYKLIAGIGGHTLNSFSVADSIMQEIVRRGVTAELKVVDDELLLSLGTVEGGMLWDTSGGNMLTNNGYMIPSGAGLYKALDYVQQVLVSDNKEIDLTADGVGNAVEGNATIPAAGMIIRNLDGGGKLTVQGDAAAEAGTLPDVVTLVSNKAPEKAVALEANSVQVNVGLPAGTDGILAMDAEAGEITLDSVALNDGSRMQIHTDAVVNRATSLTDGASVSVAEEAVLTTAQLNGDATSTIEGKILVDGVGGDYQGAYGAAGADVVFVKGAYQTIAAGEGLSLSVEGGEGTLNLTTGKSSMTHLGVGTDGAESQLIINNVAIDEKAGKVTLHTLNLAGEDNYIENAEVTVSLGAESSAETLGSDKAPVIIDGSVTIRNADVVVRMVTAQENLRALDVNPDAPLKDAVLAQLVTVPTVSGSNEVSLTGNRAMQALLSKYYTNARLASDGTIRVDRVTDYYSASVAGLSEPGTVGVAMMDQALLNINPQAHSKEYTDLAGVMNALDDAVVAGKRGEVDRVASAVSGASAAALGAALVGDVERQLRAIRNRTTTMGVDQGAVNHNMPYFNAWINAEVDNRTLDQDGMLPGYDYTTTGGTFGFDVDVTPRFTFGVAFSSLRGDFSSESADQLDADVESFYISGFARATYRRWTHTFVATFGKSDLSMDRMVSYSGGSYKTQGDTEAANFGVMYEMGYVMALDVDGTSCLQPVFNISLAHSSMDAYTERGSDAALSMGDVDMTTLTIGVGARMQSVVGENLFNRASIFEARALVKLNAGDREASVENTMVTVPTATGTLSSAERGPVSLELGAGITVPVGAISGSIFVDGAAELGSAYTGLNATVGYRLNF